MIFYGHYEMRGIPHISKEEVQGHLKKCVDNDEIRPGELTQFSLTSGESYTVTVEAVSPHCEAELKIVREQEKNISKARQFLNAIREFFTHRCKNLGMSNAQLFTKGAQGIWSNRSSASKASAAASTTGGEKKTQLGNLEKFLGDLLDIYPKVMGIKLGENSNNKPFHRVIVAPTIELQSIGKLLITKECSTRFEEAIAALQEAIETIKAANGNRAAEFDKAKGLFVAISYQLLTYGEQITEAHGLKRTSAQPWEGTRSESLKAAFRDWIKAEVAAIASKALTKAHKIVHPCGGENNWEWDARNKEINGAMAAIKRLKAKFYFKEKTVEINNITNTLEYFKKRISTHIALPKLHTTLKRGILAEIRAKIREIDVQRANNLANFHKHPWNLKI
ncbi:hypothetical protein FNU76_18335 [Chitinimonas arctica]|uniref:Uncharacterized protein n=1 Tax=Chitinimonas arctica TaxID=2594795 RepID=A0A516SJ27_9NEIS|nr:hypothetical protein [Chitinimonas arctica]QDQ28147.1 hypothetical protein FNU76_18335 [Chitinimonas arctica]